MDYRNISGVPTNVANTFLSQTSTLTSDSRIEEALLRSSEPINVNETEEATALGHRGILLNRNEILNWRGPPISEYKLNDDPNPEVINKTINQPVEYTQEVQVKYLRPPTPPPPGELIIRQETVTTQHPPAPPLIIRQHALRPPTPEPLIIRENPPEPPPVIAKKIITVKTNNVTEPPPRKVIIEKLPPLPPKPQPVIIERWLPYKEQRRRVIFESSEKPFTQSQIICKCLCSCKCKGCKQEVHCVSCCVKEKHTQATNVRNTIIQWSNSAPIIKKNIQYLGVVRADPYEYASKYGATLKRTQELPSYVSELDNNNSYQKYVSDQGRPYQLEGDIEALKLVDLEKEGLSMYRHYVSGNTGSLISVGPVGVTTTTSEVHSYGGKPYFHSSHEIIHRY